MSVTIKEIAEITGLSRGTIDKVIHNRPGVKKETRDKVNQVLKAMNYQPNIIGKALVQSNKAIRIGIILTPDYNPFVVEILQGIKLATKEMKPFGIEVTTRMLTMLEPVEQLSILNTFESENYAGIAVFPLDDNQVIEKINTMAAKGIAIINFNSQLESINSLCFIGQDHYAGGRVAAGLLRKLIPENARIGVIISTIHLSCHQDRLKGFRDKLAENCPNMQIVSVLECQDQDEEAFRATMKLCQEHHNLDGIYITSGGVPGLARALILLDLANKIRVVCHDLPLNSDLLDSRIVEFSLDQSAEVQGYQLVKTMSDYLIKHVTPPENILIPSLVMSEELRR